TAVTSHELVEAVTDPDVSFAKFANDPVLGWVDNDVNPNVGLEIADLAQGRLVYLNGYCVQRIASKNDQAMTPAGSTSSRLVSFVLNTANNLYACHDGVADLVSRGVAFRVSDQGIDNDGHAMIDLVTPDGHAVEYHDVSGRWVDMGWGFRD